MTRQLTPALGTHDGTAARDYLDVVLLLYAEVYAEPPYSEGPADVVEFADDLWPWYVERPGFRLVIAALDKKPIGFTFGFSLSANTTWWTGFLAPTHPSLTEERAGQMFAIIELAVRAEYRGMGVGRALYGALLAGRSERRLTLCARPEAQNVVDMYLRWGYDIVGRKRPGPDKPIYLTLVRQAELRT